MMVDYDGGHLRISNPSGWSTAILQSPGFRRTRYDDIEYATSVAGSRGMRIGHSWK